MNLEDCIYFWFAEAVHEYDDTQHNLATRIGITDKHLSQIMTRKARVTPWIADRVAAVTGRRWAVTFYPDGVAPSCDDPSPCR